MITSLTQSIIDLRSTPTAASQQAASTPAVALDLINSLSQFDPAKVSVPSHGARVGANLDRYL